MNSPQLAVISNLLEKYEDAILSEWTRAQLSSGVFHGATPKDGDIAEQSRNLLRAFRNALREATSVDIAAT